MKATGKLTYAVEHTSASLKIKRTNVIRAQSMKIAQIKIRNLNRHGGALFARGQKHKNFKPIDAAFANEEHTSMVLVCEAVNKRGKGEDE